jgi:hypothetical protein
MKPDAERFDAQYHGADPRTSRTTSKKRLTGLVPPRSEPLSARKQLQEIGAEMIDLRESAPATPRSPAHIKMTIDAVIS